MADFNLQGLLGGVSNAMMSPQALAGIGLLSGEGMQGAAQGVFAGTQNLRAQELQRQAAIKQQRDEAFQQQFANGNVPAAYKGLPASLIQAAALAGPDQGTTMLGNAIIHKGDTDAQVDLATRMANLDFQNKMRLLRGEQGIKLDNYRAFLGGGAGAPASPAPAPSGVPSPAPQAPQSGFMGVGAGLNLAPPPQAVSAPMDPRRVAAGVAAGLIPPEAGKMMIDGDQESKVRSRAQVAQQLGMDPNDPVTKQYLLTGSYPKQEKNYPAILKADESVNEVGNSIDTADDALAMNKNAYGPGFFSPETKAWVGGILGLQGAKDTQQYQADAKLLAGQLAKSLSGARPTKFEQQLMSKLQGSLDQPVSVRQNILQQARNHLVQRQALAQKQAEELRNGTYYQPGNTGAPKVTHIWNPKTGKVEAVGDQQQ